MQIDDYRVAACRARPLLAIVVYRPRELSAFDARLHGFNPSPFSNWGDPLKLDI